MPTNYPAGFDEFIEPTIPESTPLSSAGSGNFNHPQSHTNMGDAIESIQHNAALKGHDHSGDAGDRTHGGKLLQANTHQNADTDLSVTGIHHTLGTGQYQAAAGNHTHDYASLTHVPWNVCTSTTRPGSPFPGMMIYETDTNVARVWNNFPNNHYTGGITATINWSSWISNGGDGNPFFDSYSGEVFYADVTLGMQYGWDQWYADPGSHTVYNNFGQVLVHYGAGHMGLYSPGGLYGSGPHVAWLPEGNQKNRSIARRTYPSDAETVTDDQVLILTTEDDTAPLRPGWYAPSPAFFQNYGTEWSWVGVPGEPGSYIQYPGLLAHEVQHQDSASTTDAYLRMSADRTSYWRFQLNDNWIRISVAVNGPTEEFLIGQVGVNRTTSLPSVWKLSLVGDILTVHKDGQLIGSFIDLLGIARKGEDYRGWGIGMYISWPTNSPGGVKDQIPPAPIQSVKISDYKSYDSIDRWTLLPLATVPTLSLRQNTAQHITSGNDELAWDAEDEDPFGFFDASRPNQIVCTEPGVYHVDVKVYGAVGYGNSRLHGETWAVRLNGNVTHLVDQLRTPLSIAPYPGISPNEPDWAKLSGNIRLGLGDVLTVCPTPGPNPQWDWYTWHDIYQSSSLTLNYISP